MRVTVQRVSKAEVVVDAKTTGKIGHGLLVFAGFEDSDDDSDIDWISNKIINLRIFNDDKGVMNHPLKEADGELLVVSQFTLHASTKKGNRPSYIKSARAEISIPLYEKFLKRLKDLSETTIQSGIFGADMKVSLINDGPVTINIDSKNRE